MASVTFEYLGIFFMSDDKIDHGPVHINEGVVLFYCGR